MSNLISRSIIFRLLEIAILISLSLFASISSFSAEQQKIVYLHKVGEIKGEFSSEKSNFFWRITGLCCDDKDNLFVADSGVNKIFKFDPNGKFIASFGKLGQGPGEFLGSSCSGRNLLISYGNDGKIYVVDQGNKKLSVFSVDGIFINEYPIPEIPYSLATVNSKGDIYLLSKSGIKLVECYDSNLKYKTSLVDLESHLQFPCGRPSSLIGLRVPNEYTVLKLITRNDKLIIISNFSLRVFVFDEKNKQISEFRIEKEEFVEDLHKAWREIKEQERVRKNDLKSKSKKDLFSVFILPFRAFLDSDNNICLVYRRSDSTSEIYKYKINGTFLGTLRFPEKIEGGCIFSSRLGKIYSTQKKGLEIGIYEIEK